MHENLIPIIEKIERAVAGRNTQEIITILTDLQETFIYSGNEVYNRFNNLKNEMIVVLFKTVEITEFCRMFLNSKNIHQLDIWESLETIADRVTFDALWTSQIVLHLMHFGR